jgi:hypothetical protein
MPDIPCSSLSDFFWNIRIIAANLRQRGEFSLHTHDQKRSKHSVFGRFCVLETVKGGQIVYNLAAFGGGRNWPKKDTKFF